MIQAVARGSSSPIIEVKDLKNYLGGRWVHDGINFSINAGEIVAVIGASGGGKTTLLRSILMLLKPTSGEIKVLGCNIATCSLEQTLAIKKSWGVLFQMNALFSSLTVLENVIFPLVKYTSLRPKQLIALGLLKIELSGLDISVANLYPAELSGGMQKRAALARAIAMDPELVFLDEPTAGLDPNSAAILDELVLNLRSNLGLTFMIATHDLDTLWKVPDRVIFLGEGKVLAFDSMKKLVQNSHPLIQAYFQSYRGQSRTKKALFVPPGPSENE